MVNGSSTSFFLAMQAIEVGNIEMGYMNFRSSLELLERVDTVDYYNLFATTVNLGDIHSEYNDYDRAIDYYEQGLNYIQTYLIEYASEEEKERYTLRANTLRFSIAIEKSKKGDFADSEKMLQYLLNNFGEGDGFLPYGALLNELGLLKMKLATYDEARGCFLLIVEDETIEKEDKGIAYHNLGTLSLELNKLEEASQFYLLALNDPLERGDDHSLFVTYLDLGEVYFKQGNFLDAIECWELALEALPILDDPKLFNVYDWLRKGYEELGQRELAKSYEALYVKYKEGYEKSLAVIRANEDRDEFLNLVERLRNEELEKELKQDYTLMIILTAGMAVMLTCLILIRRKKIRQKKLYEKLGSILKGD